MNREARTRKFKEYAKNALACIGAISLSAAGGFGTAHYIKSRNPEPGYGIQNKISLDELPKSVKKRFSSVYIDSAYKLDLDGNGKSDFLVSGNSRESRKYSVNAFYDNGSSMELLSDSTAINTHRVRFMDLSNDEKPDLIITLDGQKYKINHVLRKGEATSDWRKEATYSGDLLVTDANSNFYPDMIHIGRGGTFIAFEFDGAKFTYSNDASRSAKLMYEEVKGALRTQDPQMLERISNQYPKELTDALTYTAIQESGIKAFKNHFTTLDAVSTLGLKGVAALALARGFDKAIKEQKAKEDYQKMLASPTIPGPGCGDPYRECVRVENPHYRPPQTYAPRSRTETVERGTTTVREKYSANPNQNKPGLEPFEKRVERDMNKAADDARKAIDNVFKRKPGGN